MVCFVNVSKEGIIVTLEDIYCVFAVVHYPANVGCNTSNGTVVKSNVDRLVVRRAYPVISIKTDKTLNVKPFVGENSPEFLR